MEEERKKKKKKRGKLHRTAKAQCKDRFIATVETVTKYTHIHIHP